MMTKEESTKIVNLITPGARVLELGLWRGYISHYSQYALKFNSININHIDCYCIKGI